ncbi:MAG: hypothetical protein ABIK28_22930, partial [Planctomycetota bacterium]
ARVAGSEQVIRGPFTLERIFYLGQGDLLLLGGKVTALAADYSDGNADTYSRVMATYTSEKEAAAAFAHVRENLDANIKLLASHDTSLVFKDYSDKFGTVDLRGSTIELTVNRAENPMQPHTAR